MPRGRDTAEAMRFEQLCHATKAKRRIAREAQRMDDMRLKTCGWLELRAETEGLEIEADMAGMMLRGLTPIAAKWAARR